MAEITGGCLCGKVRYRISADPLLGGLCHCRDCQRYTGSAFEPWMVFSTDAVAVDGLLKVFSMTGGSGKAIHRRFCPDCASGVLNNFEARPDRTVVLVGTLDDPSLFTPTMEIHCDAAQPWMMGNGQRTRFPKGAS